MWKKHTNGEINFPNILSRDNGIHLQKSTRLIKQSSAPATGHPQSEGRLPCRLIEKSKHLNDHVNLVPMLLFQVVVQVLRLCFY